MSTETRVAAHYLRGNLADAILRALPSGHADQLTPRDLAPFDEFHVGGLEATEELATQMNLRPGMSLLDVGSGIGGPARYFAAERACRVTGIDVTPEFVAVAKMLTQRLKLDALVDFVEGSALNPPFQPETFDAAYMIHVGMNISAKAPLFQAVRRVLKTGAPFAVFDIMRTGAGEIRYPLPWALSEETSFIDEPQEYRRSLEKAGFVIAAERDRRAFAIDFTRRVMARMAQHGPPVLGMQLLMGEKTPLMLANVLGLIEERILAPVEIIAKAG